MKITVLDGQTLNPGDLSWDAFSQLGETTLYEATSAHQILERSQDSQALIVNKVVIDQAVMDQCSELQYIGVVATGYNNVDIAYAAAKGISVTNVPLYGTASVSQMVFAHILNHACRFTTHVNSVQQGDWIRSSNFCYALANLSELQGKTIGIVGLGRTGTQTAQIATAFGMQVIAYHYKELPPDRAAVYEQGYKRVDLPQLFAQSDYVSLHIPLTATNASMINQELLSLMPSHGFLVNTARGGLINEQDLADALNSDRIAGAGLDVLSTEPPRTDNPLLTAKNCFITPHIAWITKEARERLLEQSVANLRAWVSGQPINLVKP
ncbi:MAG: D-2-hydroxyacid dehydrogenase [Cyanobacteria bacterium P01_F01_bin.150]